MIFASEGPAATTPTVSLQVDLAERELTRLIITLELAPGTQITYSSLAQRVGCGVTPVREAIQRLAVTGLVLSTPNRGVCIAPLDIKQYSHALDTYTALGGWGVRRVVELATADDIARLEGIRDELQAEERAGNLTHALMLSNRFDHEMYGTTGNPFLVDTMDRLNAIISRFALAHYSHHPEQEPYWDMPAVVLDAIRRRDADGAENLHGACTRRLRERMLRALLG